MKLWPTPTPANGVIHHPKESEQFFPKKKERKKENEQRLGSRRTPNGRGSQLACPLLV